MDMIATSAAVNLSLHYPINPEECGKSRYGRRIDTATMAVDYSDAVSPRCSSPVISGIGAAAAGGGPMGELMEWARG